MARSHNNHIFLTGRAAAKKRQKLRGLMHKVSSVLAGHSQKTGLTKRRVFRAVNDPATPVQIFKIQPEKQNFKYRAIRATKKFI